MLIARDKLSRASLAHFKKYGEDLSTARKGSNKSNFDYLSVVSDFDYNVDSDRHGTTTDIAENT